MQCQRCGYETSENSINATCALCGTFIGTEGDLIGRSGNSRYRQPGPAAASRHGSSLPGALTQPLRWVFNTLYASLAKPDAFFAPLRYRSFPREALLYGLVVGSIGTILLFIMNAFVPPAYLTILSKSPYYSRSTGLTPTVLVMTPLILVAQFFLAAGYTQLMLLVSRSRKKPFSHTFSVMCYASGAAIFQWIPVVGPFAAIVAWFYLVLAGIRSVHGITRFRAFMVLILPLALLFALFLFLAVVAAVIALAVGGSRMDLLHFLHR